MSVVSNIFSPFVASLLTPFTPSDMWACYVNEGLKGLPPSNLNRVKTLVSKQLPFQKVGKVIYYSNLNSTIVVISMRKFVSLTIKVIFMVELFGIWKPTRSADVSPNWKNILVTDKVLADTHISPLLLLNCIFFILTFCDSQVPKRQHYAGYSIKDKYCDK